MDYVESMGSWFQVEEKNKFMAKRFGYEKIWHFEKLVHNIDKLENMLNFIIWSKRYLFL